MMQNVFAMNWKNIYQAEKHALHTRHQDNIVSFQYIDIHLKI